MKSYLEFNIQTRMENNVVSSDNPSEEGFSSGDADSKYHEFLKICEEIQQMSPEQLLSSIKMELELCDNKTKNILTNLLDLDFEQYK